MKEFKNIKSEVLKPCGEAFRTNMERSASFSVFPVELLYQASRNARMTANAIYKTKGIGALTLREQFSTSPTPEMVLEFAKEAGIYERSEDDMGLRYDVGVTLAERLLQNNAQMRASIEALFTSIVLESWLFFEALCGDLWVAGVDNGGPAISARVIANREWESGKEQMLASSAIGIQSNANTHPGSYRREIGQVSFQKLRSLRGYFKVAFGNDADRLFDDTAGGYIYALSAMRNCITHSAGKVDHMFKTSVGKRFPELSAWELGSQILLDGALVKKLRNAACDTGRALLECVDAMLMKGD